MFEDQPINLIISSFRKEIEKLDLLTAAFVLEGVKPYIDEEYVKMCDMERKELIAKSSK